MAGSLLVKNAQMLVTMDGNRREIADGGLYAENGVIKQVGDSNTLPDAADRVIDTSGQIVLPGFINTHHHLICREPERSGGPRRVLRPAACPHDGRQRRDCRG